MPSDASPRFAPPIRALSPTRRGALLALSAARPSFLSAGAVFRPVSGRRGCALARWLLKAPLQGGVPFQARWPAPRAGRERVALLRPCVAPFPSTPPLPSERGCWLCWGRLFVRCPKPIAAPGEGIRARLSAPAGAAHAPGPACPGSSPAFIPLPPGPAPPSL